MGASFLEFEIDSNRFPAGHPWKPGTLSYGTQLTHKGCTPVCEQPEGKRVAKGLRTQIEQMQGRFR